MRYGTSRYVVVFFLKIFRLIDSAASPRFRSCITCIETTNNEEYRPKGERYPCFYLDYDPDEDYTFCNDVFYKRSGPDSSAKWLYKNFPRQEWQDLYPELFTYRFLQFKQVQKGHFSTIYSLLFHRYFP